ncbi:MAG TPA: septum site-determining protein MinC [Xanthomonadaceae bacterium]|jgi:septum site-determining protein MinC|nr:septum site-determining protein MinC [Xanthomonadaceae bacterium]
MAATVPDYEQAGELKIGQVGIANLRIRTLDVDKLVAEMRERVQRAPKLFERAAVVVDFGSLSRCPDAATARALVHGLQQAGVLPVALAFGTTEIEKLARELCLPLLAKFRAQYERAGETPVPTPAPAPVERVVEPAPVAREAAAAPPPPEPITAAPSGPGMVHTTPVRSGQQVYAQQRDLTICAAVGAGAEVIADGSVHIYGPLRGRALAGALGNTNARIFCREFHAELVAVAGNYKVLDEIPANLLGKAVQVWLQNDKLHIEELI